MRSLAIVTRSQKTAYAEKLYIDCRTREREKNTEKKERKKKDRLSYKDVIWMIERICFK